MVKKSKVQIKNKLSAFEKQELEKEHSEFKFLLTSMGEERCFVKKRNRNPNKPKIQINKNDSSSNSVNSDNNSESIVYSNNSAKSVEENNNNSIISEEYNMVKHDSGFKFTDIKESKRDKKLKKFSYNSNSYDKPRKSRKNSIAIANEQVKLCISPISASPNKNQKEVKCHEIYEADECKIIVSEDIQRIFRENLKSIDIEEGSESTLEAVLLRNYKD